MIRNEFPTLRVAGRGTWVHITVGGKDIDEVRFREEMDRMDRNIHSAVEFRWLIEALVGGDITAMPPEYFQQAMPSDVAVDGARPLRRFAKDLQSKVSSRQKVLVGHNPFLDLLNLYSTFLGTLPEKVEEFQEIIHKLFPLIIDTKYMATENSGRWNNASDLQWVEKWVRTQEVPRIDVPCSFDRYRSATASFNHEAGYDSLLTAKIAIKLPVKIQIRDKTSTSQKTRLETPFVVPARPKTPERKHLEWLSSSNPVTPSLSRMSSGVGTPVSRTATPQPANWQDPLEFGRIKGMFSSTNKFEALVDQPQEARVAPNGMTGTSHHSDSSISLGGRDNMDGADGQSSDLKDASSSSDVSLESEQQVALAELMPRFDSPFWKIYGNKLRMNACKEGVWELGT